MEVSKEQVALYGGLAYIVLSGVSGILTAVVVKWQGAPPWLVTGAKWVGVVALDVHKIVDAVSGGES